MSGQAETRGFRALSLAACVLLMCALAVVLAACNDNTVGPSQFQVTNVTDDFQWVSSNLDNVTQTFTYDWPMTGNIAQVIQAVAVTRGRATLMIRASNGSVVWFGDLGENGTSQTGFGSAGTWRIILVLNHFSGSINVRVMN